MNKTWRIASAQINCTVGDLDGNSARILACADKAKDLGADIVVFPELAITGYPPEDLLLKTRFIDDNIASLEALTGLIQGIIAIVGFVDRKDGLIYNGAAIVADGGIKGVYHKMLLPNYGVFDEKRYFSAGREPMVCSLGGLVFGVNICEDVWFREGPTRVQAQRGARLILNMNASPYHAGKMLLREEILRRRATENRIFISYTNLVGGQDELVFDGQSMVLDPGGMVIGRALAFQEDLLIADISPEMLRESEKKGRKGRAARPGSVTVISPVAKPETRPVAEPRITSHLDLVPEIYQALLLGLHDYVTKNGFKKVTVGLSGGIDSALVAVLAVDALGKENVAPVFMPSRFTSEESRIDAEELADNLGVELLTVPIDGMYKAYLKTLKPFFTGLPSGVTEENIQARVRGNILMAFSNKFGWLVLTTGNKSEMSVGYATLYGDMAGGFAVIKDVPKVLVYELCRHRNSSDFPIPERILSKEPTAELRPGQKDTDTLPPYETLDPILKAYIEEDRTAEEINVPELGRQVVTRTLRMVDLSEYKRRQAPPGIKITPKAFGRDRRMPITNKYRG